MSALTLMPKVIAVLRWYADRENYSNGSLNVAVDNGERARAILAELAADGIDVREPVRATEPKGGA